MDKRRFPVVPVVSVLLKITAVLLLAFFVQQFIGQLKPVLENWALIKGNPDYIQQALGGLIFNVTMIIALPALAWACGDGLCALREIEFNTRRPDAEPAAEVVEAPVEDTIAVA